MARGVEWTYFLLKLLRDIEKQVEQAQLKRSSGQQEQWSFEALQKGLEGTLLRGQGQLRG